MNSGDTGGRQPEQADDTSARISGASEKALEKNQRRCQFLALLDKNSILFDPKATVASVAKAAEVSERTIYHWLARKAAGESLLDRPRGGAGKFRGALRHPGLQHLAVGICLPLMRLSGRFKPPIAAVRERMAPICEAKGWTLPGKDALRRFLERAMGRAQRIYAAGGEEAYLRQALPKPPVQWAFESNVWWVVDHQLADDWVIYRGRKIRPWVTVIRDMFDGTVLAVYVSDRPNAWAVGCALRIAIERWGLPLRIYADRGKDMMGHHIEAVLGELGVELVNARGRSPWSKGRIEAFFSVLSRTFYPFYPGYTGNRPTSKPLPSQPNTLEQFRSDLVTWVETVFNKRAAHSRRIDGRSISYEGLRGSVPYNVRKPRSKALMLHLLKRTRRQVGSDCCIHVGGVSIFSHDALTPLAEERASVEIRYDPADMGHVWVFYKGELVCEAVDAWARALEVGEEDIRQRGQMRRRRLKAVRDATDPILQAADQRETYFAHLEQQRQAGAVAAAGGDRGRAVQVLLPTERAASRPQRRGGRTVSRGPFKIQREAQTRRGAGVKSRDEYDPFAPED